MIGNTGIVIVQLMNALLIFVLWYLPEKILGKKIYSA